MKKMCQLRPETVALMLEECLMSYTTKNREKLKSLLKKLSETKAKKAEEECVK